MGRYALEFAKNGYMTYTSHLDMMRLFKRAFKRADLPLSYSKGYNPHPKMSFAQPLSLGYASDSEFLEFQLDEPAPDTDAITSGLASTVPAGLDILRTYRLPDEGKTMASAVEAAAYELTFPIGSGRLEAFRAVLERYLSRDEITALKREKKSKQLKPVNIRPMIRSLSADTDGSGNIRLSALLDQGSSSNLSPDLVVSSLSEDLAESGMPFDRYEVGIRRKYLVFSTCFPQIEGLHCK